MAKRKQTFFYLGLCLGVIISVILIYFDIILGPICFFIIVPFTIVGIWIDLRRNKC